MSRISLVIVAAVLHWLPFRWRYFYCSIIHEPVNSNQSAVLYLHNLFASWALVKKWTYSLALLYDLFILWNFICIVDFYSIVCGWLIVQSTKLPCLVFLFLYFCLQKCVKDLVTMTSRYLKKTNLLLLNDMHIACL